MAKSTPYHHGNLRQALLDAAWQVAEAQGLSQLSLREVTRMAGVSHAAPYYHFADKAALIEAMGVDGFERLDAALRASQAVSGTPLERLAATGMAYTRFAVAHPIAFRLMFRPELRNLEESPALTVVRLRALSVLEEAIQACIDDGNRLRSNKGDMTVAAWSMVHGLATLIVDGPLLPAANDATVLTHLAELCTQSVIYGLVAREQAENDSNKRTIE